MKLDFKWNKPIPQIAKDATGGNRTLLFMASEAKRLMNPYVPAKNLILAKNVRVYVEGGKGVVHYLSPYARYQHGGMLMVSRITGSPWARKGEDKVLTNKPLKHSKSRHPLATSHWEKAMMAARGDDYEKAVQSYVRGGV